MRIIRCIASRGEEMLSSATKALYMKALIISFAGAASISIAAACNLAANTVASSTSSSSTAISSSNSSSNASSEVAFTGSNGIHTVNGDTIRVENGALLVNGVSYGRVEPDSQVKYAVRGNQKTLTVDGRIRMPVQ